MKERIIRKLREEIAELRRERDDAYNTAQMYVNRCQERTQERDDLAAEIADAHARAVAEKREAEQRKAADDEFIALCDLVNENTCGGCGGLVRHVNPCRCVVP